MNKHYLDIEIAKELYHRGIITKAEKYYPIYKDHEELTKEEFLGITEEKPKELIPAPMSTELLELMTDFKMEKKGKLYSVYIKGRTFRRLSLANALGDALIWLDDNGFIKEDSSK